LQRKVFLEAFWHDDGLFLNGSYTLIL